MAAARRYIVHGRVQGVGYRYFALTCAEALGVNQSTIARKMRKYGIS